MKLKSKSSLFNTIIARVDQQLASIPLNDAQGSPLEDSTDFDMHVDAIKEMKLTNETKKILSESINVTATAVRVPVSGGHSEAVNIEHKESFVLL